MSALCTHFPLKVALVNCCRSSAEHYTVSYTQHDTVPEKYLNYLLLQHCYTNVLKNNLYSRTEKLNTLDLCRTIFAKKIL